MHSSTVDIVIPLGSTSKYANFELRMALRSIHKYGRHCRNIYLVGSDIPTWVRNCRIIEYPDHHRHNKDANLIDKLLAAAQLPDLSRKFIFWSDDQVALHRFSAVALQPAYNRRSAAAFDRQRIWHRRMKNTLEYLQKHGCSIKYNWDSHLPQIMDKELFCRIMSQVNYTAEPGFCINTLYFGLLNTPPVVEQSQIKKTIERGEFLTALPGDKLFLGYNDSALQGNLAGLLLEHFPHASVFEE
ncbi:MAG: hypothetical protein E7052_00255 [Lentisphaerae bacterium]|nr:hypothetical protein [Lentisphaerota bacterium]